MKSRCVSHPADILVAAMERIYRYRMTTTSGGNLSIRMRDGSIWITPARVDKGELRREDMVCVRPDGTSEGRHPASSEFPFHAKIYAQRPDLNALVHAHPVSLVAFSICGKVPDTRVLAKSREVCGEVGFAPYALPGSALLGEKIAAVFAAGHDCVMLENHGVVVGGEDFQSAFERFETLEFTAKILLEANTIGGANVLSASQLDTARSRRFTREEMDAGACGEAESRLRRELADFVKRGYRQRLLTSTQGSFSVRVDEERFLVTPYHVDRASLEPDDLVLVQGTAAEQGKEPSHATPLHAAIYAAYPAVSAVINATPVYATAFAVSRRPLDSRTIPESYVFLRDVRSLPFEAIYGEPLDFVKLLNPRLPVSLVENDGALVLGATILDAFDRLEVLETTAQALIAGAQLGDLQPMPENVIRELEQAFKLPPVDA